MPFLVRRYLLVTVVYNYTPEMGNKNRPKTIKGLFFSGLRFLKSFSLLMYLPLWPVTIRPDYGLHGSSHKKPLLRS